MPQLVYTLLTLAPTMFYIRLVIMVVTQPGSVAIIVLTCTSVSELLMYNHQRAYPGTFTVVMG